jgi:hypothetical protein
VCLSNLSTWEPSASVTVYPQSFQDLGASNDLDTNQGRVVNQPRVSGCTGVNGFFRHCANPDAGLVRTPGLTLAAVAPGDQAAHHDRKGSTEGSNHCAHETYTPLIQRKWFFPTRPKISPRHAQPIRGFTLERRIACAVRGGTPPYQTAA